MPRKPKPPQKQTINVVIDGAAIPVSLYPPTGKKKSWYAYWPGLLNGARTTGHADLEQAKATADTMVRSFAAGGAGDKPTPADLVMTDAEFDATQRAYYKVDPATGKPADEGQALSYRDYNEAVRAFRELTKVAPIATATPRDCARFQELAKRLPRNWRSKHPRSKENQPTLSENTIYKWSRALRAAFERCNRNNQEDCVRSEVPEEKLLDFNPWHRFRWTVDGSPRTIRQFDAGELNGLLDYIAKELPGVTVAATVAKVFVWSGARRKHVTRLSWSAYKPVNGEHHFILGKLKGRKRRWVRVPDALYAELRAIQVPGNDYLFAGYLDQLRDHHATAGNTRALQLVGDTFKPAALGEWMYGLIKDWSATLAGGSAYLHTFRKTFFQFAEEAEAEGDRATAEDAGLTPRVLGAYVDPSDRLLHKKANATYRRLLAGLPEAVLVRYGCPPPPPSDLLLLAKLKEATEAGDFPLVGRLAAELTARRSKASG